jgi:hypothetical protein
MSSPSDSPRKKLGSLAQSARGKQLNQIRGILFFIGILTIAANGFMLLNLDKEVKEVVDQEVRQAGGKVPAKARQEREEELTRLGRLLYGAPIALGAIFVVFGIIVHRFPVPVTVLTLVLYVGATIIFAVVNPETLRFGIVIKVIIVVAMAKAIQTAIVYQNERAQEARAQAEPDLNYE